MTELESTIRSFLAASFLPPEQAATLTNEDDLLALLDSLQVLRTLIHLESSYGFKVEDDELNPDNLGSIARLAAFVERKRSAASMPQKPAPLTTAQAPQSSAVRARQV